ncbi:hypothetical protein OH76DRAFT_768179 [Lentinus brumalis]|uniref:Uncharacterized protein n=1 Tax=Lentinus brumalis TaxID=2498619 RepID=A0A371D4T3_9APHY|nr:hypothetical protein OH76DRAFT_768179 [Polyporus brumalis]
MPPRGPFGPSTRRGLPRDNRLMESLASSPSVYSQSSSYPASSSLRTPSPLEPLPPTYEGPLTCLDIYPEWFSHPQDMTKPDPDPTHLHRRRLLDILTEGRARRRRAPSPQSSLPESEDPLACVELYRQWFAQDMAKDDPAHRRRLLDILTRTDRGRDSPPHSLPDTDTHSDSTHSESSSIHAPQPILGWSPVSYWNDETLASWSQAASAEAEVTPTDVAPSCYPSWDLWDRMQAHNMICMHPRATSRRADRKSRDGRTEQIRRRRRILLLEELVVRCDLMTMNRCRQPVSREMINRF